MKDLILDIAQTEYWWWRDSGGRRDAGERQSRLDGLRRAASSAHWPRHKNMQFASMNANLEERLFGLTGWANTLPASSDWCRLTSTRIYMREFPSFSHMCARAWPRVGITITLQKNTNNVRSFATHKKMPICIPAMWPVTQLFHLDVIVKIGYYQTLAIRITELECLW